MKENNNNNNNNNNNPIALHAKGLKKKFGEEEEEKNDTIEILRDVELKLYRGQTAAIMGQSGSGKSTLLSILAGLETADKGTVSIDGTEILSMNETKRSDFRAKKISIVFQQFHLINHLNTLENTYLPLEISDKTNFFGRSNNRSIFIEKAKKILEEVQLSQRINHFPHQLSGGEQQRLAIARAVITHPCILFADEPTGNLDQETSEKVIEMLFKIVAENKITMLLVTHDTKLAKKCDEHYSLVLGKLQKNS